MVLAHVIVLTCIMGFACVLVFVRVIVLTHVMHSRKNAGTSEPGSDIFFGQNPEKYSKG